MKIYKLAVGWTAVLLSTFALAGTSYWEDMGGDPSMQSNTWETSSTSWDNGSMPVTSFLVDSITQNSAVIHANMDEKGQGYFVVLPSGAEAPNAEQVRDGRDATGIATGLSDSGPGEAGSNEFTVYNLSPSTNYTAYFVAENSQGDLGTLRSGSFTTQGSTGSGSTGNGSSGDTGSGNDRTPPDISSFFINGITNNGAVINTIMDEPGQAYFVLLPPGSAAPTASQVRDWTDASGKDVELADSGPGASGEDQFPVYNLRSGTPYTLYFTVEDAAGNLTSPEKASFTTLGSAGSGTTSTGSDNTPPNISSFTINGITSTGAVIQTTMDEAGQGYFVLLSSGSAVPSAQQVRDGQNASGGTALLSDNGPGTSWEDQFPVYNLTPATMYNLYFVAEDMAGNLSTPPKSAHFQTLAGTGSTGTGSTGTGSTGTGSTGTGSTGTGSTGTGSTGTGDTVAPTISALAVTGITNSGAMLSATVNESGTWYFVVLPNGSVVPTATQVRNGTDAWNMWAMVKQSGATVSGANQFPINGLTTNTTYLIYFTAMDRNGNLQQSIRAYGITTR